MNFKMTTLVVTKVAVLAGCASVAEPETDNSSLGRPIAMTARVLAATTSSATAAASSGLPEYRQLATRSQMAIGPGGTSRTEFGIDKMVGAYGTQGVMQSTGLEMGLPNSDAPTLTKGPYGSSLQDHNDRVRSYFVSAGIPDNEIAGVDGNVGGMATGPAGSSPTPVGPNIYYSVLRRSAGGIPVSDSFAWARINVDSEVVEESVYWPAIPQSVIDQAIALRQRLADSSALSAFRASLPQGPSQVSIRHSHGGWAGPFEVHAVYEVATAAGPRDFDGSGNEIHVAVLPVPQQKR